MTTSGLFATVSSVEDDAVVLEVAPGVHSRYAKQAVLRVINPEQPGSVDLGTSSTDEPAP